MIEAVKKAIEEVRPSLQMDGGDIEFVSLDEKTGIVSVRLTGSCGSCPMALMTLKYSVETYLKKNVPGVNEVVQA